MFNLKKNIIISTILCSILEISIFCIAPQTTSRDRDVEKHLKTLSKDFKATVEIVTINNKKYIKKSLASFLKSKIIAKWLMYKQYLILEKLQGIEGIPKLYGSFSNNSFYYEYIPGNTLNDNYSVIPDDFFENLLDIIYIINKKGVTHGNIGSAKDILISEDGRPYLLDFEKAVPNENIFYYKWMAKILLKEDIYHVYKHKLKFKPDLLTEEELKMATKSSLIRKIYKAIYWWPRNQIIKMIDKTKLVTSKLILYKHSHSIKSSC